MPHEESQDDDDEGGITKTAVLAALGIGGGVWGAIAGFGERLSEAESFREIVVDIILTELVGWILSVAEYLFGESLFAIELIAQSFWASIVVPFGDLYDSFTEPILGALQAIRTSVETAVASTGLAAPFVALAGWVAVLLVVAVIVGVLWALAETYLPTEAITENAKRIGALAMAPFDILRELLEGALDALRGDRTGDGGNDDT